MKGNKQLAARRKLLGILSRTQLERLADTERAHMMTRTDLISMAALKWDLQEVHDSVERIFRHADPEGTSP